MIIDTRYHPPSIIVIRKELVKQNATRRNQGDIRSAKAAYLIRDTMKVVGHSDAFTKPICALFYVDLENPMEGRT